MKVSRLISDPFRDRLSRKASPLHQIFGARIRDAADELRERYPEAGPRFIVETLEYDLGIRAAVIEQALEDEAA